MRDIEVRRYDKLKADRELLDLTAAMLRRKARNDQYAGGCAVEGDLRLGPVSGDHLQRPVSAGVADRTGAAPDVAAGHSSGV